VISHCLIAPNFFGFYSPELEGFTGLGHHGLLSGKEGRGTTARPIKNAAGERDMSKLVP